MRFKTDENLPEEAAQLLRASGHDVASVHGQGLGGRPDPDIHDICVAERRILVTLDTDFANVVEYPLALSPGRIVIRSRDQSKPVILSIISRLVSALESSTMEERLWVVESDRIRVRSP